MNRYRKRRMFEMLVMTDVVCTWISNFSWTAWYTWTASVTPLRSCGLVV